MSRRTRFRASMLLLAAALSAAPALARGHSPIPPAEVHSLFGPLWHALDGLLPAFTKGRGTVDPNGSPPPPPGTTAPTGSGTDGRGTIDPDG